MWHNPLEWKWNVWNAVCCECRMQCNLQCRSTKNTVVETTRSSATAEKQRVSCPHRGRRGARPSSPLPLRPSGYTYMRMVESESHVKCAVRKVHFKMNRAFKVIQGHPYWFRQESRMVCCPYVQLMPTLFLKLTKIRQRKNGKFVDFNDLTQV